MSVRKRVWQNAEGHACEAWVADYVDNAGKRRQKTFRKKKDADNFVAHAHVEVRAGVHVADAASVTVGAAGELWIAAKERAGREATTIVQYRQHLDLHITPFLGSAKLTALAVPLIRNFEDGLIDGGRSPALTRKIMVSLSSLLADALERGLVARNVAREMRSRRGAADHRAERRAKGRLRVGVDIPTPDEVRAILGALEGRWRPLLIVAFFTGMRASELRGLAWDGVDLRRGIIRVHQRADRFKKIGKPKSEASDREIPLPPIAINTLREWKLVATKSDLGLVFPDLKGEPQAHRPIVADGYGPAQVRAKVTKLARDGSLVAKYPGLHSARHWFASWCINRKTDGGLELLPKIVQERLGHASITLTMDTYGHLFPRADDGEELALAEARLFGGSPNR
jgi:integrase